VAFHHADLSYRQRRILEEGYRKGEIKVMVSTTTLAMGVNLPAQSVFIDCYKYLAGKHSGRMMLAPLDWNDYEAMSGRAGRYGSGRDFGRSILIAGSKLEAETMWKNYIEGAPGELVSQLPSQSLADTVLDLISSRVVSQRDQLLPTLQKSYYAHRGGAFTVDEITEIIARLERLKLISVRENQIAASPIGRLLSLRGVTVSSGMHIVDFCRRFPSFDRLSWLYLVLSLPDASPMRKRRTGTIGIDSPNMFAIPLLSPGNYAISFAMIMS
jgi:helicase